MTTKENGLCCPCWAATGAALAAMAVGLGAYGAHGLEGFLEGQSDIPKKLEWWTTATQYLMMHALGLLALGLSTWHDRVRWPQRLFIAGIVLFSGSLYLMSLGAPRFLGAIVPLGGLSFIVGWALLTFVFARSGKE